MAVKKNRIFARISGIINNVSMKSGLKKTFLYKFFKSYKTGKRIIADPVYLRTRELSAEEVDKRPFRTDVINFLLKYLDRDTTYLEIGVRNPDDNFNHISAGTKYSVDPGVEFARNPADFKVTSDEFFAGLDNSRLLSSDIRFDVIFIDGLHLAEQADRDIVNSLRYIKDDGFIVIHDCNPPSEWHARETYNFHYTPAGALWNGTTWKAFLRWRFSDEVNSCCIDSDWGVGILSKNHPIGKKIEPVNPFFEFETLRSDLKRSLNLVSFEDFRKMIMKLP